MKGNHDKTSHHKKIKIKCTYQKEVKYVKTTSQHDFIWDFQL
jgi:hypothetical protein